MLALKTSYLYMLVVRIPIDGVLDSVRTSGLTKVYAALSSVYAALSS